MTAVTQSDQKTFPRVSPPGLGRGFTLVELLVVIGIIAVLISILLPSLNKAREAANRVACQSNMKQVMMATHMYANANKGVFPCAWKIGASTTRRQPNVLLTQPAYGGVFLSSGKVFDCPSDITRGQAYVGTAGTAIPGGYCWSGSGGQWYPNAAGTAPTPQTYEANISYVYNTTAGYVDNENGNTMYYPYRLGRKPTKNIKNATAYDVIWFEGECGVDQGARWTWQYNVSRMKYTSGGTNELNYSARHGDYINVAGADGHVEALKIRRGGKLTSAEMEPWNDDLWAGEPSTYRRP